MKSSTNIQLLVLGVLLILASALDVNTLSISTIGYHVAMILKAVTFAAGLFVLAKSNKII